MADFTGFYYGNDHSSTYHLIRTSVGDRYEEELFSDFEDETIKLVGGSGSVFGNTRYKEKEFTIPVAFDNLLEEDFRKLQRWLKPDGMKEFRFDERPYKAYIAKLKSPPKFEYVCFMRQKENSFLGDQERVYKGEAKLDFIAYNPFGYCCDNGTIMTPNGLILNNSCNWQELSSYNALQLKDNNTPEWAITSGLTNHIREKNKLPDTTISTDLDTPFEKLLLDSKLKYNEFLGRWFENPVRKAEYITRLYNPGDLPCDYQLYLKFNDFEGNSEESSSTYPYLGQGGETIQIQIYSKKEADDQTYGGENALIFYLTDLRFSDRILIETKKHSLKIYHDGNVYSENNKELRYDLIKKTSWQKIPCTSFLDEQEQLFMKITSSIPLRASIKYNYIYY